MYMHKTPIGAGNTLFMQTSEFLESLPDEELKYLESLKVIQIRDTMHAKIMERTSCCNAAWRCVAGAHVCMTACQHVHAWAAI